MRAVRRKRSDSSRSDCISQTCVLDLVDTAGLHLLEGGYVDGEHFKASLVETWPLAQLLHNLHEDLLTVSITARLVRLRK